MDANRLNENDGNYWEEVDFGKINEMVAINDLDGNPIKDYEMLLNVPALIDHYIETSVDEYELEIIIGQCIHRIDLLRRELQGNRSIEWTVLGDK